MSRCCIILNVSTCTCNGSETFVGGMNDSSGSTRFQLNFSTIMKPDGGVPHVCYYSDAPVGQIWCWIIVRSQHSVGSN